MRIKLINLEKKILANEHYLTRNYPDTYLVLSQINMLLDFGMNDKKITEWYRTNKTAIQAIYNLLRKKNVSVSTNI